MKRPGRSALLLLLGSGGLVLAAAAVLVFSVPSFKHAVKERWHRWSCPEVPADRSERMVTADGNVQVRDPLSSDTAFHAVGPDLFFTFDSTVVFSAIGQTLPARGRYLLNGTSAAIIRRVGDVMDHPRSISVGSTITCSAPSPDLRIVIRIDHPDGTMIEWNQKRLIVAEHRPGEQEHFNFEWILRDLSISPDDLVAIFLIGDSDEEIWIDDLSIVFRSAGPIPPTADPHA